MLKGTNAEISASTGGRLAGPIAKAVLDAGVRRRDGRLMALSSLVRSLEDSLGSHAQCEAPSPGPLGNLVGRPWRT